MVGKMVSKMVSKQRPQQATTTTATATTATASDNNHSNSDNSHSKPKWARARLQPWGCGSHALGEGTARLVAGALANIALGGLWLG